MNKSKISITVDNKILEKIREIALNENRNLSNQIEVALVEYIAKHK